MKQYADFSQDSGDLTYLQKVLAKGIIVAREPILVGTQLLAQNTKLVGQPGKTLEFKKTNKIYVNDFNEKDDLPYISKTEGGTPIGVDDPTFDYDMVDITPSLYGGREPITKVAIDDNDEDTLNNTKTALAKAMARKSDRRILDTILGTTVIAGVETATGDGAKTKFQLKNAVPADIDHVLYVTKVTVDDAEKVFGTDYWIDFYRGHIEFLVAPANLKKVKWWGAYATGRYAGEVATVNSFGYVDMVINKNKIVSRYGSPTDIVQNENQTGNLEIDDKFIAAAVSPDGQKVIKNGIIGTISNLRVLTTQQMYEGVSVVVERGAEMGYLCYKQNLYIEVEKIPNKAGDLMIKTWEMSKPGIVNSDVIQLILNSHPYAKKITTVD